MQPGCTTDKDAGNALFSNLTLLPLLQSTKIPVTPCSSNFQQDLLDRNIPGILPAQHVQQPAISRQNDALSLDTIATALQELEQLNWSKRSLSVNAAELQQVRMSPGLSVGASSSFNIASTTPNKIQNDRRPLLVALGQRRSCEPPVTPSAHLMRQGTHPLSAQTSAPSSNIMTSSPVSGNQFHSTFSSCQSRQPNAAVATSFSVVSAAQTHQQKRSTLSNSVPESLDSYQIETETIDSGVGNDSSSYFYIPSNFNNIRKNSSSSSSHLLRHSAYQNHSQHYNRLQMLGSRRLRASSTAAAGPASRRHLFYCRHHLQARQKPYQFPISCLSSAIRNDNAIYNISNGLPASNNQSSSNHSGYFRHSYSMSSQSTRSITPGSSPTRSSETDLLVSVALPLKRSRSLDDVHRSANASTLGSRPVPSSGNQSELGQWDPEEQDDDDMIGITGWNPTQPVPSHTPQFYIQDWPPATRDGPMFQ